MIPYATQRPGPGFSPIRTGCYLAQRAVTHPTLRRGIARVASEIINMNHSTDCINAASTEHDRYLVQLKKYGYAVLPRMLTEGQLSEIQGHLSEQQVVLRSGKKVKLSEVPPSATLADLPLQDVLVCPHVLGLANDPRLLAFATRFLKCLPTISTIGIRWSYPGKNLEASTQQFHRDTDDLHFFKFFTYLSDVDETAGPHLYVEGSHLTNGSLRQRRISEDEIKREYGKDSIIAITGSAGTNFVANTYGIHAGPLPTAKPRLMLEVGYSVFPIFALDYKPIVINPRPPVDRYVNRLLVA